jgi:hypothetical protein
MNLRSMARRDGQPAPRLHLRAARRCAWGRSPRRRPVLPQYSHFKCWAVRCSEHPFGRQLWVCSPRVWANSEALTWVFSQTAGSTCEFWVNPVNSTFRHALPPPARRERAASGAGRGVELRHQPGRLAERLARPALHQTQPAPLQPLRRLR